MSAGTDTEHLFISVPPNTCGVVVKSTDFGDRLLGIE